jgi:hypothetical protein
MRKFDCNNEKYCVRAFGNNSFLNLIIMAIDILCRPSLYNKEIE